MLLSMEHVHQTNGLRPDYIFGNVLASNIIRTTALQMPRIYSGDNSERDV